MVFKKKEHPAEHTCKGEACARQQDLQTRRGEHPTAPPTFLTTQQQGEAAIQAKIREAKFPKFCELFLCRGGLAGRTPRQLLPHCANSQSDPDRLTQLLLSLLLARGDSTAVWEPAHGSAAQGPCRNRLCLSRMGKCSRILKGGTGIPAESSEL